ncbi:MAG: adaptor protein MecA [Lachnospiraceae bacterium]|nr:adaptor protein MecA [Lachnospiraceae bacterium]
MKIERLNENQIRCTLTREDLESRHMKLSELAYGTEKAKALFHEMMKFAYTKYGFEADDVPLMIEAIPISADSIVLIITKVDYPEELDTRFSRFSDADDDYEYDDEYDLFDDEYDYEDEEPSKPTAPGNPLKIFRKRSDDNNSENDEVSAETERLFSFTNMDTLFHAAGMLSGFYFGRNSLYRKDDLYYLLVTKDVHTAEEFNKVCNILTEYGSQVNLTAGLSSYLREHYTVILSEFALQVLNGVDD